MNEYTRKGQKIIKVSVGIWMATVIPLAVLGFWWWEAWAAIFLELMLLAILATIIAADRRWEGQR